jgi:hypothetical protein
MQAADRSTRRPCPLQAYASLLDSVRRLRGPAAAFEWVAGKSRRGEGGSAAVQSGGEAAPGEEGAVYTPQLVLPALLPVRVPRRLLHSQEDWNADDYGLEWDERGEEEDEEERAEGEGGEWSDGSVWEGRVQLAARV